MYIDISASITYNISLAVNAKQVRPTPWKTPLRWDPPTPNKPQTLWGNEKHTFFFQHILPGQINKSKLDFQHIYTVT